METLEPHFLFICAPQYPQGSRMRKHEETQTEHQANNLMKELYKSRDYRQYKTMKIVDTYDGMLQEIKNFVRGRELSQIPFVVFLGHGTADGKLRFRQSQLEERELEENNLMTMICQGMDSNRTLNTVHSYVGMQEEVEVFLSDKEPSQSPFVSILGHRSGNETLCFPTICVYQPKRYILCSQALDDVTRCFQANRPEGMPEHQLRFVFAQCYGHLVDENNTPGTIREHGIEYTYITSTSKPKSTGTSSYSTVTEPNE